MCRKAGDGGKEGRVTAADPKRYANSLAPTLVPRPSALCQPPSALCATAALCFLCYCGPLLFVLLYHLVLSISLQHTHYTTDL